MPMGLASRDKLAWLKERASLENLLHRPNQRAKLKNLRPYLTNGKLVPDDVKLLKKHMLLAAIV